MSKRRQHPSDLRKRERFLARTSSVWGLRVDEVERRLSGDRRSSVRINSLKDRSADDIARELEGLTELQPIQWCPNAYHILGDKRAVTESALHQDGYIYVMNASSLIPALAMRPEEGSDIFDVCAAPGGKSAHIAELTQNKARLWVNDGIKGRLSKLREVVDLLGVKIEDMTNVQGQYLDKFVEPEFDFILLDAQCSGEGMVDLSRSDGLKYWAEDRIEKMGRLQQRMLVAAFKKLKPGGVLVYSTCTIAPEENEAPVDHLIRHNPNAKIEDIPLEIEQARPGVVRFEKRGFHPDLAKSLRVVATPHMEAFYVCRIRKELSP